MMPYKEAHDIIHCYKYFRMRTPGHVIYVGVDIRRVVQHESNFNTNIYRINYVYSVKPLSTHYNTCMCMSTTLLQQLSNLDLS